MSLLLVKLPKDELKVSSSFHVLKSSFLIQENNTAGFQANPLLLCVFSRRKRWKLASGPFALEEKLDPRVALAQASRRVESIDPSPVGGCFSTLVLSIPPTNMEPDRGLLPPTNMEPYRVLIGGGPGTWIDQ